MTPLQKEVCQLFPTGSPVIRMISKIGESPDNDKTIRTKCPVPKTPGKQLVKGTFWYAFRYHVWPRLFAQCPDRQQSAIKYLQQQRAYFEKQDRIYPPRPITAKV